MNEIKRYIQFAIDNEYDIRSEDYDIKDGTIYFNDAEDLVNIEKIITSKEFIESIARGISKKVWKDEYNEMVDRWLLNKWYDWDVYSLKEVNQRLLDTKIHYITLEQAIAIRDGTLDECINNLLQ